jgi:hypothetical protein
MSHDEMNNDGLNAGLKLWLSVGSDMAHTAKKLNETNDRLWNRLQFGTPTIRRESKAAVYPASGYLVINLGKPSLGFFWDVESIVIGGTDLNVAAAGTAGVYVSGSNQAVSPGITSAVDYAASLPFADQYGYRDISLNYGDHLQVIIFGGTAGQTYSVNAVVTQYNVAAALGDVSTIA